MATSEITLQQGLNEVVMNKVQRMIDGKAVGVQATMERLINEGKIAQDYIAPIGVNLRAKQHSPVITFGGEGHLTMNMPDGQFTMHDNAVGQIADRMGIPQRYLRSLACGEPWAIMLAFSISTAIGRSAAACWCARSALRCAAYSLTATAAWTAWKS